MANEALVVKQAHTKTRLFAFAALSAFLSAVGYASYEGYRAATDAFVAPIILSPDNDAVVSSRMKLSELMVEKAKTASQMASLEEDLQASAGAVERLRALHSTTSQALAWTSELTERQAGTVAAELASLEKQKVALAELASKQSAVADQVRSNVAAGLVTKLDLAREEQAVGRWQVAVIETERSSAQARALLQHVASVRRSLSRGGPVMPEQVARDEQLVRIELETTKLESEMRAKRAERKVLAEKLEVIVAVEKQLRARPLFRALDGSLDVAFVPYTQLEGMAAGAPVYDCVWGLVHCRRVGAVSELVPGEVILPDPWGNQARGQYAILELQDHEAARSKTLRVRSADGTMVLTAKKSEPRRPLAQGE